MLLEISPDLAVILNKNSMLKIAIAKKEQRPAALKAEVVSVSSATDSLHARPASVEHSETCATDPKSSVAKATKTRQGGSAKHTIIHRKGTQRASAV